MELNLNAEANVTYYSVAVDGGTPIQVTPNADGSATVDLSSVTAVGAHTVTAEACNASGCSAPASWPFTVAAPAPPIPAVPTGSITS
jgi:hypothetical protein